jgi:hypothetical protein
MSTTVENLIPQIQSAQIDINIHVSAQLNITPFVARQKVNHLLVTEASTGLGSDPPELIVTNNRLCWRVPISLALPSRGRLGQVGQIEVDAQTGEILANTAQLQEIVDHAERLFIGATSSAKP